MATKLILKGIEMTDTLTKLRAALEALEGGDLLCEITAAGLLKTVIAEMEAGEPVAKLTTAEVDRIASGLHRYESEMALRWLLAEAIEREIHARYHLRSEGCVIPGITHPHPKAKPVILERGKYHKFVDDDGATDWEWFESGTTCDDCIDVVIVRADSLHPKAEPDA